MEETKEIQPIESVPDQEARIRELTEENELLFEQLHVVQEELEKYYYRLKECENRKEAAPCSGAGGAVAVVSPKAAAALAENQKLHALVKQLQAARQVEGHNSTATRLGQVLIDGVSSTGSLLALPGKLRGMWKELDRKTPPAALGGKNFQKVLDAYGTGKESAVENLLDAAGISHVMRANAYTALARHLMNTDATIASSYARRAWESDPRPYRLKWLASRVYEAGDTATAEALLDMLPRDITMSASEQRQVMRIRQQAKQARDKKAGVESGKAETEGLRAELKKVADQARQEATRAREAQAALQRQMEAQKKESDALALQTALMLKNMLTQFEADTAVLSRMMRVVMGAAANREHAI